MCLPFQSDTKLIPGIPSMKPTVGADWKEETGFWGGYSYSVSGCLDRPCGLIKNFLEANFSSGFVRGEK